MSARRVATDALYFGETGGLPHCFFSPHLASHIVSVAIKLLPGFSGTLRERHTKQPEVSWHRCWQLTSRHNSFLTAQVPEPLCFEAVVPPRSPCHHLVRWAPLRIDNHQDQNLHVLGVTMLPIPDLVILISPPSFCFRSFAYSKCWLPSKAAKPQKLSPEAVWKEYHSNCNPGCPFTNFSWLSNTLTHFMLLGRKHLFLFAQPSFPYKVVLNVQFWVSLSIYYKMRYF